MSLLYTILIFVFAVAVTITIHEAAHAWMADRLGDPTARVKKRLSLNPLVHYDPVGTTILLVTAILTILGRFPFPFGWAKPVPFDPYNLKNPRKDSALISLSGPLSNLIFAILLSIALRLTGGIFSPLNFQNIISFIIVLNVALAVFNLIPIHPLDGGKILVGLLPRTQAREVDLFLNRYGFILLLFLIFPTFGGVSFFSLIISPLLNLILTILIPGNSII